MSATRVIIKFNREELAKIAPLTRLARPASKVRCPKCGALR